jgi:hypothetical protein
MSCSTNVSKKAAGCIVRIGEGFFILNKEVVSFYQSAWLHVLGNRLILLPKDFLFTLEVLDNDFNIIP